MKFETSQSALKRGCNFQIRLKIKEKAGENHRSYQTKNHKDRVLYKHRGSEKKKKKKKKRIPGCRAQGSKVPSRHCRPEYQPDQCELRCTLSFSQESEGENQKESVETKKGITGFHCKTKAFIKTPSL
jgi:hypothetical protein